MIRSRRVSLLFLAGAILCAFSFLADDAVITFTHLHSSPGLVRLGKAFTKWGDFLPLAGLILLLLVISLVARRPFWSRVFALMLGSSIAAGLVANLLRALTGRARPSAHVPPGWYGMKNGGRWIVGQFQYSSFPSAHTAVAFGAVVPLCLFAPVRYAGPAVLLALGIAASRMILDAHHLSDVLCSMWLGALVAMALGSRFGPVREPIRQAHAPESGEAIPTGSWPPGSVG